MPDDSSNALALLAVCVFTAICTEVLPVGLLPEISRGLGVSAAAAGVLVSLYAVLVAVVSVPIAAFTERWPRRSVLAGLLSAYCASNVVFAVAPNYAWAMTARVIGGLAHAGFFGVAVAAAVSLVDTARSGRAIAVVMIGNALALVFGVPLGTLLGTAVGWRWAFGILAAATASLAVAVVRILPAEHPEQHAQRTPVIDGLRRGSVLILSAVIVLLALGHFTLYTYISPLLLHDGVARADIGFVLFAYGGGGLVGLALATAVVARWPVQALLVDCLVMAASLLLGALAGSPVAIVLDVVMWGVAFGAFPTLTQTVALRAARGAADTAAAMVNATTNVGIAGGALLGASLLGRFAVPDLGWIGAALAAASIAVYAPALRRLRDPALSGTGS